MHKRANLPPLQPPVTRGVLVWDRFVRIFHWSVVYLFGLSYMTGDRWDNLHEGSGYLLVVFIAARVVWGFVGPSHARFADFIYHPVSVLRFLRDSLRLKARRYLGHNPAGGAMVLALLATISVICASGVMMGMDAFWGAQWVEDLHVGAVNLCLVLVVLHLVGVGLASFEHRENLVRAMWTGRKRPLELPRRNEVPARPVGTRESSGRGDQAP